jgi:hypothetical protein
MEFDLIADQRLRAGRDRLFDQSHGKIRNADVPRQTDFLDIRQRTQGLLQRHPRIGPMQQQQIDLGKMQLAQAFSGGALKIVRREMRGPDLGRHEHIVALDPGGAQAIADLAFVLVDLRGVDVAIAEPQRLLDQT